MCEIVERREELRKLPIPVVVKEYEVPMLFMLSGAWS
jgi:hypothetical protein